MEFKDPWALEPTPQSVAKVSQGPTDLSNTLAVDLSNTLANSTAGSVAKVSQGVSDLSNFALAKVSQGLAKVSQGTLSHAERGRLGAKKRSEVLSPERRLEISRRANEARRRKKSKAIGYGAYSGDSGD